MINEFVLGSNNYITKDALDINYYQIKLLQSLWEEDCKLKQE